MKRVLITGGTGSFGRAAAARLLALPPKHAPERIIVYSRDEQKQADMAADCDDPRLTCFLGDVRDRQRLTMAMHGVDTVIHAAALKIVPKGEFDPSEFIATNITGTDNIIHAALEAGVVRCILLSTDKAVAPLNLYGATKLAAEKLFIAANNYATGGRPQFSVVRYGNVACSRGSAINVFRKGIRKGQIALTHKDATRFWITLDDAVNFVLEALRVMSGGEVFIPRMPSFRITDLIEAVVATMPEKFGEPVITITGLRPGEKVHEDLITVHEAPQVHVGEAVYVIVPPGTQPAAAPLFDGLTSQNNISWLDVDALIERMQGL